MTVRDLVERLEKMPQESVVLRENVCGGVPYSVVTSVSVGVNELDWAVIIGSYVEEE